MYYIIMYFVWAFIIIVGAIVELHTIQQIGGAASISGLIALIIHASLGSNPIWPEIVAFLISWITIWVLLFLFLRKIRHRIHDKDDGFMKFIGMSGIVTKENISGHGEVKVGTQTYRAKSNDILKIGDNIVVEEIKGVTMMVRKEG